MFFIGSRFVFAATKPINIKSGQTTQYTLIKTTQACKSAGGECVQKTFADSEKLTIKSNITCGTTKQNLVCVDKNTSKGMLCSRCSNEYGCALTMFYTKSSNCTDATDPILNTAATTQYIHDDNCPALKGKNNDKYSCTAEQKKNLVDPSTMKNSQALQTAPKAVGTTNPSQNTRTNGQQCLCTNNVWVGAGCGAKAGTSCSQNASQAQQQQALQRALQQASGSNTSSGTCTCISGRYAGTGCGSLLSQSCSLTTPTLTPTPTSNLTSSSSSLCANAKNIPACKLLESAFYYQMAKWSGANSNQALVLAAANLAGLTGNISTNSNYIGSLTDYSSVYNLSSSQYSTLCRQRATANNYSTVKVVTASYSQDATYLTNVCGLGWDVILGFNSQTNQYCCGQSAAASQCRCLDYYYANNQTSYNSCLNNAYMQTNYYVSNTACNNVVFGITGSLNCCHR